MMIGANDLTLTLSGREGTVQYSPKQKVIITGIEMFFSHWITSANGRVPFFHYYINGQEFGYINHDLTQTI